MSSPVYEMHFIAAGLWPTLFATVMVRHQDGLVGYCRQWLLSVGEGMVDSIGDHICHEQLLHAVSIARQPDAWFQPLVKSSYCAWKADEKLPHVKYKVLRVSTK